MLHSACVLPLRISRTRLRLLRLPPLQLQRFRLGQPERLEKKRNLMSEGCGGGTRRGGREGGGRAAGQQGRAEGRGEKRQCEWRRVAEKKRAVGGRNGARRERVGVEEACRACRGLETSLTATGYRLKLLDGPRPE
eukprot:756211-Hanusia_phi.AAC.2